VLKGRKILLKRGSDTTLVAELEDRGANASEARREGGGPGYLTASTLNHFC